MATRRLDDPGFDDVGFELPGDFVGSWDSPAVSQNPPHVEAPPVYANPDGYQAGGGARSTEQNNNDALSPGSFSTYDDWAQNWLERNKNPDGTYDTHRLASAYGNGGHNDGARFEEQSSSGGGGNGGGGAQLRSPAPSAPAQPSWIDTILKDFATNGAMNTGRLDQRVDVARDRLNRQRKSQTATNNAALANRGLIGDGPQATAMGNLETRLGEEFAGAYQDIHADESRLADQRTAQALSLASGMSIADAQNAIDLFRANTERDLGFGQLDLGWGRLGLDDKLGTGRLAIDNMNGVNNYNLGLGQLGLNRDQLAYAIESGDTDQLIKILEQIAEAARTGAGGYIGR